MLTKKNQESRNQVEFNSLEDLVSKEHLLRKVKGELILDSHYENPEQARKEIFKHIELYYNTKRIHSYLMHISPAQFEEIRGNTFIKIT